MKIAFVGDVHRRFEYGHGDWLSGISGDDLDLAGIAETASPDGGGPR